LNVHPTKAWVRFRHPRLIYEMVAAATQAALRRPGVMPGVDVRGEGDGRPSATAFRGVAEQVALFGDASGAGQPRSLFGRVLGQVQETFVVSTSEEEVFFLDQHVAHERVLFERLQHELREGLPAAQALLFAEPLELPRHRPRCSSAGASPSSVWASRSRDSEARPSCCAPCPRCSRATSPSG